MSRLVQTGKSLAVPMTEDNAQLIIDKLSYYVQLGQRAGLAQANFSPVLPDGVPMLLTTNSGEFTAITELPENINQKPFTEVIEFPPERVTFSNGAGGPETLGPSFDLVDIWTMGAQAAAAIQNMLTVENLGKYVHLLARELDMAEKIGPVRYGVHGNSAACNLATFAEDFPGRQDFRPHTYDLYYNYLRRNGLSEDGMLHGDDVSLSLALGKLSGMPFPIPGREKELNIFSTMVQGKFGHEILRGRYTFAQMEQDYMYSIPTFCDLYAERLAFKTKGTTIRVVTPQGALALGHATGIVTFPRTIAPGSKVTLTANRGIALQGMTAQKRTQVHCTDREKNRREFTKLEQQGMRCFGKDYSGFDKTHARIFQEGFIRNITANPHLQANMLFELDQPWLIPAKCLGWKAELFHNLGRSVKSGESTTAAKNSSTNACVTIEGIQDYHNFKAKTVEEAYAKNPFRASGDDGLIWGDKKFDNDAFQEHTLKYGFKPDTFEGCQFLMVHYEKGICTNYVTRFVQSFFFGEKYKADRLLKTVALAAWMKLLEEHPLLPKLKKYLDEKVLVMDICRFRTCDQNSNYVNTLECKTALAEYAASSTARAAAIKDMILSFFSADEGSASAADPYFSKLFAVADRATSVKFQPRDLTLSQARSYADMLYDLTQTGNISYQLETAIRQMQGKYTLENTSDDLLEDLL